MGEHCPFCDLTDQPTSPFDVNYRIGDGTTSIMPALGMMMPGYLLAVTREHLTSFAQLELSALKKVNSTLSEAQTSLEQSFGPYVRVEHGSDGITNCGSGGCVEHAHQHLVPNTEVGDAIFDKLPWEQLDSYEDITAFRGAPYIYLGRLGLHYVVPDPDLPGQWTRRQIAQVQGHNEWDWVLNEGAFNLLTTFAELQILPDRPLVIDMQHDSVKFMG